MKPNFLKSLKIFPRILIFFILISFTKYAVSQNTKIGVQGGGNITYLFGNEAPQLSKPLLSYNGGVFVQFFKSDITSIHTGINYISKKYEFTNNIEGLDYSILSISETNTYLSVPVMFSFKKGDNIINAFVNFGLEVSVFLKNNRISTASIRSLAVDPLPYYNFDVNFYDYGGVLGGGIQFRSVVVDARYFFSLRNLYSGLESREMRYMNLFVKVGFILNYQPPSSYSRPTTWKSFKYNIRHLFK